MRVIRSYPASLAAGLLVAFIGASLLVRWASVQSTLGRTAAAQLLPQSTGPALGPDRLLVSEPRGAETVLVSVSASDTSRRRPLLRIPHANGWEPRVALSPSGDRVAYTVLPPGAAAPDTDGVLWVADLQGKQPRRLAERLDVRTPPVWSPDGARLVVQRMLPGAAGALALEEIDVRSALAREIARAAPPDRLFPVGYRPDGMRLLYARFERGGAFLHDVRTRDGADSRIARLGDGAARDFKLSPAADALLYLALTGAPPRYRAMLLDVSTGDVRPLLPGGASREDVGVAWRTGAAPAPAPSAGYLPADVAGGRIVVPTAAARPISVRARGFDVPVAWSADGRWLVVRAFSGDNADAPGREDMMVVDTDGNRQPLAAGGAVEFVAWGPYAP